jgi:hypothetical protein
MQAHLLVINTKEEQVLSKIQRSLGALTVYCSSLFAKKEDLLFGILVL